MKRSFSGVSCDVTQTLFVRNMLVFYECVGFEPAKQGGTASVTALVLDNVNGRVFFVL